MANKEAREGPIWGQLDLAMACGSPSAFAKFFTQEGQKTVYRDHEKAIPTLSAL